MNRRTATVLGTLAAAFMLAITPASAQDEKGYILFSRPCGSQYSLDLLSTRALGIKHNTGCQGHVWVRVHGDSWGDWHHHEKRVELTSPRGKFDKALVKGCADCEEHTVYPKDL